MNHLLEDLEQAPVGVFRELLDHLAELRLRAERGQTKYEYFEALTRTQTF